MLSFLRVSLLVVVLSGVLQPRLLDAQDFQRCDCNADGAHNIADAVRMLNYLFNNSAVPDCLDSCDCNDDGSIDISDPVFQLSFLKPVGPPVTPPWGFGNCDPDGTLDALDCALYAPCP
ncbi:MAG: dockerin type I domain-containing protein [Planctomycetota bacterium]